MPLEFWGATAPPGFLLPQRPLIATLLLLFHVVIVSAIIYHQRKDFLTLVSREWLVTGLLSLAAVVLSQLFLIPVVSESQLPPLVSTQNPRVTMALFAALPMLLAGASMGAGPALIVGFFTGLSKGLWGSHQLFDPFYYALVAALAGWWLTQNFEGRLYKWMRLPIVSGPLSLVLLLLAFLPAFFSYASGDATWLAAFDWSLSATRAHFLPLLLEGVVGGFAATIIVLGVPQVRYERSVLQPAPQRRSVRNRLLINFAVFAVLLSAVLLTVVFTLSINVAERLSVNQMVHDAEAVSRQIPAFRTQTQNLLRQYSDSPVLVDGDEDAIEEYLAQLVRSAGAYYRRVILVDASGDIVAYYPDREPQEEVALTALEEGSVSDALSRGAPSISPAQIVGDQEPVLSIVVPVRDEDGAPVAALIGRVPGIVLENLVIGLQGTVGEGSGFIVDERNQIIAHADEAAIMSSWSPPDEVSRSRRFKVEAPGEAYESLSSETNARQLNYERLGPDHPWRVVISVPHQVVLRLALQISSPLIAVLAVGMLMFGLNLVYLGRGITTPLGELVQASQQLAAGQWDVSVPVRDSDEVGQLGHAFERMRRSMQRHFNDMELMLEVSHDISSSIDIQQGIPVILRGAVRGTGAVGVGAIVLNPNGRQPLTFGEGPAAPSVAAFGRRIALLGRQENEIALSTPEQVRNGLRLRPDQELPVQALVTMALVAKDRFQGVIWVGYRQPHEFAENELNLLRTMANQASVLVENARLFATAEGQRRRLAAVLASTQDAVIVTDQTDRVLLLNPAMS
ncbi:MAG TPA: cache domain-containing protein, partial [Candidatus Binatia bacterium]|nr:cache domain-containing protein [Candidatus Binatia bacterium]